MAASIDDISRLPEFITYSNLLVGSLKPECQTCLYGWERATRLAVRVVERSVVIDDDGITIQSVDGDVAKKEIELAKQSFQGPSGVNYCESGPRVEDLGIVLNLDNGVLPFLGVCGMKSNE